MEFAITVTDPDQNLIFSQNVRNFGKVAFTSEVGGEHMLCFQSQDPGYWSSKFRNLIKFDVDIDLGSHAVDYDEIARSEELSGIQQTIRRLQDEAADIMKEQAYLKERELVSRDSSEVANSRVMWWSIFETILLVLSGVWQVQHLKRFFQRKKIV